jgi:hypothetical protein
MRPAERGVGDRTEDRREFVPPSLAGRPRRFGPTPSGSAAPPQRADDGHSSHTRYGCGLDHDRPPSFDRAHVPVRAVPAAPLRMADFHKKNKMIIGFFSLFPGIPVAAQ